MQGFAWLLFVLFAADLAALYMAIRREWFAPGQSAAAGVLLAIILMFLISLAQGNSIIQAVVVGVLVGGMFGGAILAIAWYFHSNELRALYSGGDMQVEEDPNETYADEE
ncbi:MAG: hypothetical protein H7175_09790 [Burkholderiales bacterium]|nr:hypothetical protein [Anaerolineae bacterium]